MKFQADAFELSICATESLELQTLLPCTSGQRRMWVLDRLEPGNPALNVAVRWRIEGKLPTALIEQAFDAVLQRHAVLRTRFVGVDGEPLQRVEAQASVRIQEADLRHLDEVAASAELARLSKEQACTPFDLDAPPPYLRVVRVFLQPEVSMLLVTMHHIACDGWSIGLLAHEVLELCAAASQKRQPRLPELPLDYAGYASLQAQWLQSEAGAEHAAFWERQLHDMPQFELPVDKPRPAVMSPNAEIVSELLPRPLTDAAVAYARERGCTVFMLMLSTLLTLLHRYSGETDIGIGTQVAARELPEVESLIGLFVNTVVLRTDLAGDPGFETLLDRVREVVLDAFEHQGLPIEHVIERLKPVRDRSRNALFSINFVLQRSFVTNADYGDFRLVDMPSVSAGAMHDMNFFMVERPDGWRLSCDFNTDLFERETVTRLLQHMVRLLAAVLREPRLPLSKLPLLTDAERGMLAIEWNQTEREFPRDRTVVELFADQTRNSPRAEAVVCRGRRLSYAELDQASNRLAHELQARGLGAGARIGICLPRSPDLIVAMLAILKSGAAYVPLDTASPAERLAFIAQDCELALVIASSEACDMLAGVTAALLLLDREASAIAARDAGPLPPPSPNAPAYVIYTSGSTGQPKGVLVHHRALVNVLWAVREEPGVSAADRFVSVSSVAFDISGLEVFLTLTVGARLVLATEQQVVDGAALLHLLREERASVMFATPVTWQFLLAAGWNGQPRLKVMCGGEAVSRELAERILATGSELWNVYGPTETTIYASALRIDRQTLSTSASVPLGGPLPNLQFYVLDRHGELAPIGAPGELYIGGEQVALGYVNRPELTRERFVADHYSTRPGARLYRTGDIVRWKRRACMEFVGRQDGQVKLRGFRIELGEVESALLRHPAVAEACVVVGRAGDDEAGILAYVASGGQIADAELQSELRHDMALSLPSYMRPAAITVVDHIPRNQNGKIDRRALPPPTMPALLATEPPQGRIEERLAAIWCAVLGRESVGRAINFFELGGHSLLAARMLARAELEFGHRVPLSTLFTAPTIAQLAPLYEDSGQRRFDFRPVLQLRSEGTRPPLIGLNNTGIYFPLSRRLGDDQPFTTLQLFDPASDPVAQPHRFEEIAAGYVELIRRVQPQGPYRLLGWCVAGALAFEVACQLRAMGESVTQVAIIDAYAPGYLRRLSWPRRLLAQASHRLQLIGLDVGELFGGQRSWREFLANRGFTKRLRAFAEGLGQDRDLASRRRRSPEDYDRWLLELLRNAVASYEPQQPYDGRVQLFRSRRQPAGLFLPFDMGWSAFAAGGVETTVIDGDHFSMFQDPGASQMAERMQRFEPTPAAAP